ncbi:MAG: Ada metal-binding domain-containing protein [bacterium]|nr:Ada metal-binding domain-containing protein [bacterium]
MRLSDLIGKIKDIGWNDSDLPKDVFVVVLIILVGLGAFLMGRLSTAEQERKAELRLLETPGSMAGGLKPPPAARPTSEAGLGDEVGGREVPLAEKTPAPESAAAPSPINEASGGGEAETAITVSAVRGAYVASKKGEVYYLPWCGGVKLIHEENKVWFATKEEAEQKGYRPAANCKGM